MAKKKKTSSRAAKSRPSKKVAKKKSTPTKASSKQAPELLRKVHDAHFQTGVAFHVGSQCRNPQAFVDGVNTALDVIEEAGVPVHYLDVGGGFPALYQDDHPPELSAYFDAIYQAFDQSRLRRDCEISVG